MLAHNFNRPGRENFQIRALNDIQGTCVIYFYALAVVVIVVGVREIYTNVEKQNSNHKRSCLVASDRKKRGEGNSC